MLSDYQRYRLFEILPGLSIWLTLVLSILLSFIRPLWMIYFIILFDIYWVLKVANFSFYLILGWWRFRIARRIDWAAKMKEEAPRWQEKHHVVFLTLFNETWDVVKTAMESVRVSAYEKDKFVIVVAGEARMREHYEDILSKIKQTFGGCFGDIVGTLHPSDPIEEPGV